MQHIFEYLLLSLLHSQKTLFIIIHASSIVEQNCFSYLVMKYATPKSIYNLPLSSLEL